MNTREHTVHAFTRLLSTRDDGLALYGCSFDTEGPAGCGATETRQLGAPSPFAMKHREAQKRAASRKGTTCQRGR